MPCWAMTDSDSRIPPSRLSGYTVAAVATAGAAAGVAAAAWEAPNSGRAATATPVPATARVRARRRLPRRRICPDAGMSVFLSYACEVSCRVRTVECPAVPLRARLHPEPFRRVTGPATYLGPPLLPCVSEFVVGWCGRRQDSASARRPGTYARAHAGNKCEGHG